MKAVLATFCLFLLAWPSRAAEIAVTKIILPNGATLLVQPDPAVNTVAICCFVRAGTAEEEGVSGVAALTARSIFGSNDNQSREAVSRDIYLAGGSLETFWEADYTLLTFVTERSTFRDAMYSLGQALKTAQFDRETVEAARESLLAEAASGVADPFKVAYTLARSRLYSDGPYRLPVGGTVETLKRVSAASLQAFYRKRYAPSRTVIAISGNVSVEEATRSAENQLIDYDRAPARPVAWRSGDPPAEPVHVSRRLPTKTRIIVAGFRGPGVSDPDYPAWLVLNAIVGGGKSSRLFRSVRDVSGVGYYVNSHVSSFSKDGGLMAVVEYDPARTGTDGKPLDPAAVQQSMLDAVKSVVSAPPAGAEVARARRFAAGKHALAHERVRDRAFHLGWYESIGAGYAMDQELPKRVLAVTPDDVLRLAKKWLKNEVVVVVEPEK